MHKTPEMIKKFTLKRTGIRSWHRKKAKEVPEFQYLQLRARGVVLANFRRSLWGILIPALPAWEILLNCALSGLLVLSMLQERFSSLHKFHVKPLRCAPADLLGSPRFNTWPRRFPGETRGRHPLTFGFGLLTNKPAMPIWVLMILTCESYRRRWIDAQGQTTQSSNTEMSIDRRRLISRFFYV